MVSFLAKPEQIADHAPEDETLNAREVAARIADGSSMTFLNFVVKVRSQLRCLGFIIVGCLHRE
jgi:hypothetical protein